MICIQKTKILSALLNKLYFIIIFEDILCSRSPPRPLQMLTASPLLMSHHHLHHHPHHHHRHRHPGMDGTMTSMVATQKETLSQGV